MIPFETIRSEIARGLSAVLSVKVIEINPPGDAPKLPFMTYDFSVGADESSGQPITTFDNGTVTMTETIEFIVDFQATAESRGQAMVVALSARDWFVGAGHDALKYGAAAIVVVRADQVGNRDVQVGDEWTYQYGFEVTFRATNVIEATADTIVSAEVKETDNG